MPQIESNQIIEEVGRRAVANAIETHRRMGRSIVVWRDGKIVHVPPGEIEPRPLPGDENRDLEILKQQKTAP